ncbi:hypothetical protein B9T31_00770 [Acinetobacter sp. ANC 4558]|uniref:hypothetical protein n=1 Tax=Acinetobacter sp. ANC 4558 TaxID=1977876 RepID=UPI000A33B534|nr:hypothetical protein [Acinetobacter sp. ANC 4558]OTG88091.1 hypothetical protein B9T31_00770 [Acinetobacter sp. ANC 4558]
MSTPQSQWQKNQSIIWLVCGVLCLSSAGIFWIMTDGKMGRAPEKEPEPEIEIQIQPEKVAATTHLGGLVDVVKPLEDTTRIKIAGVHEAEFRGNKFLNEHKQDYTIELFRASKESVIKNFLRKQESRNQFIYIRLSGEGVQEQYVLLYGNFKNRTLAEAALEKNEIALPSSIQPSIQTFGDFSNQVNDIGSDEVGVSNVLYSIKLSPAIIPAIEMLPEPTIATQEQSLPTTTKTITQKDRDGNVIDVQETQSNAPSAPKSSNTSSTSE